MRALILLLAVVMPSCSSTVSRIPLDQKWHPLKWVVRDGTVRDGWVRTDVPNVYVKDPAQFMERTRPVARDATLAHEQVHAVRQEYLGPQTYREKFADDPGFRTQEEKLGWSAQIRWHAAHGEAMDPYWIAQSLTNYKPFLTFDFPSALAWAAEEVTQAMKYRAEAR